MQEFEEGDYDDMLNGRKSVDDVLGNLTLACIWFPEISQELQDFKQMTEERGEIAKEIRRLEQRKEELDEEIEESAQKIQDHLYNV